MTKCSIDIILKTKEAGAQYRIFFRTEPEDWKQLGCDEKSEFFSFKTESSYDAEGSENEDRNESAEKQGYSSA